MTARKRKPAPINCYQCLALEVWPTQEGSIDWSVCRNELSMRYRQFVAPYSDGCAAKMLPKQRAAS